MSAPVNRPTFLTVLCLLTFMNAVSGLWTQSEMLWNPGVIADRNRQTFEEFREKLEKEGQAASTKAMDGMFSSMIEQTTPENVKTGAIIMLIFESLSLYAAYLMWNLQKRGYYLYLAGMAVAFFAPLLLIGGWMGTIVALAGVFFSIFMAICYAFNLKHMY